MNFFINVLVAYFTMRAVVSTLSVVFTKFPATVTVNRGEVAFVALVQTIFAIWSIILVF